MLNYHPALLILSNILKRIIFLRFFGQHLKESVAQCIYKVHVTDQEDCNVAPSSFAAGLKGPSQIGLVHETMPIVIIDIPVVVETCITKKWKHATYCLSSSRVPQATDFWTHLGQSWQTDDHIF